ncbi:MAG: hypothetical protein R2781_02755 [Flavobacteriaceae bacterium]
MTLHLPLAPPDIIEVSSLDSCQKSTISNQKLPFTLHPLLLGPVLGLGSWVLGLGSWVLGPGSWVLGFEI